MITMHNIVADVRNHVTFTGMDGHRHRCRVGMYERWFMNISGQLGPFYQILEVCMVSLEDRISGSMMISAPHVRQMICRSPYQ